MIRSVSRAVPRPVKLSAATLLGAALLASTTGCGGPMQAGAALVAGGQRTTDGQIQALSTEFVAFMQKDVQPDYTAQPGLGAAQVDLLVQEAMWQKAADDLGVPATADKIAQERAALVKAARQALAGSGGTYTGTDDQAIAVAVDQQGSALTPSGATAYVTMIENSNLVVAAIAAQAGISSTDANYKTKMTPLVDAAIAKATGELKIKVSPRYGAFDPTQFSVVASQPNWIRGTAPATAPTSAAQ